MKHEHTPHAVNPWVQAAMIDLMQCELDRMKADLAALQNAQAGAPRPIGRPPKQESAPVSYQKRVWDSYTPEQRQRRIKAAGMVRHKKGKATTKLSRQQRGAMAWAAMSAEQRSAEMKRRKAVAQGKAPSKNVRPYQRKLIAQKQAALKPNGAVASQ